MAHPRINTDITVTKFVLLTKADDTDFTDGACRALWVGTEGTANLVQEDGTARADVPLKPGLFPCSVIQLETGGTADDIWALY
jgi:hypothetical protein